jgi:hypothetical protein
MGVCVGGALVYTSEPGVFLFVCCQGSLLLGDWTALGPSAVVGRPRRNFSLLFSFSASVSPHLFSSGLLG